MKGFQLLCINCSVDRFPYTLPHSLSLAPAQPIHELPAAARIRKNTHLGKKAYVSFFALFFLCSSQAVSINPLSFNRSDFLSSKVCKNYGCRLISDVTKGSYPMGGTEIKYIVNDDIIGRLSLDKNRLEQYSFTIKRNPDYVMRHISQYSTILNGIFEAIFGRRNYMDQKVMVNSLNSLYLSETENPYYIVKINVKDENNKMSSYSVNLNAAKTDAYPNSKFFYLFGYRE